jgi:hypothetical protein
MKITLTNNFHNSSSVVHLINEPEQFFNRKAYKISVTTFKRIISDLCGISGCTCGDTRGDENYRLIKWDYNFRGHGDAIEYFIEVLK